VLFMLINVIWLLPWAWYAARTPAHATLAALVSLSPLVILALLAGSGKREQTL